MNKMFLKKGTLRILFSDIVLSNFFTFKQMPPHFSFLFSSEKNSFKNLANLDEIGRKSTFCSIGVLKWWRNAN
jgi:hypothetical protein